MKNRLFACLVLTLLSHAFVHAQKAQLSGTVTDLSTGESLIAAAVHVNNKGTTTDRAGKFTVSLDPGNYIVEFSYLGFRTVNKYVDLSANQSLDLQIQLSPTNFMLEEATITGSKYEQRIAESTISIDIIKSSLLESVNAVTPDDALDKVSGVQILDGQANIRGGSGWSYGAGSRVMILVDDMPALQADAGLPQWSDIPIENISQIEVVKGASSALYGSSALNGIINMRTGYATSEPETKITWFHTRYGGPGDPTKKWWDHTPQNNGISVLHKQKFGKLDLILGGHYFEQDSTKTFNRETFRKKVRLNANLRYRVTDRMSVGVNSFFNDGNSSSFFLWLNGTNGAYVPFPGTVSKSNNLRYIVDPYLTYYDVHNNQHKLRSRFYHIDNDNNLNQSNASDLFYLEYQFQRKFESGTTLTGGLLGTWVKSDSDLFSDTIITARNYAAYGQLNHKLYDRLNLSFGLRYEYNRQNTPEFFMGMEIPNGKITEGKLISRFGANYELAEGTFVRASWGQGYRYPTITERFIRTSFSGFTIFPNAVLKSETGWSGEIGIKQGYRLANFEGFLDIATFWSEYFNMMEFTFHQEGGLSGFQSQNVGDTQIKGIEISTVGQTKISNIPVRIYAGYTYIDPRYKEFTEQLQNASSVDFNVLKYRTKHNFNFDIEGEWKNFILGFALTGASHMVAIDQPLSAFATIAQYRAANPHGYKKFDSRFSYRFGIWKLSILYNNMFNEEYSERPALLEPPKNLVFRLDLKL